LWHAPKTEIVVAGAGDPASAHALEAAIARRYLPWAVTIPVASGQRDTLSSRLPQIAAMAGASEKRGAALAFVCTNFSCQEPVADSAQLDRQLEAVSGPRRLIV
jgi:uncharacterized protein YyaL (SSP411 family)